MLFRSVQARTQVAAAQLIQDAIALENAGVFALVLEAVPTIAARDVTAAVNIPTIGIGAGPHCDGQVLVSADLLGLHDGHSPKFVKDRLLSDTPRHASLRETQLAFLNSEDYSHPYYWAAFIDSGDWRPLQQ